MRLFITVLIAIAVTAGFLIYLNQTNDIFPEPNDLVMNNSERNDNSWREYEQNVTPNVRFSLRHPPQTIVSKVQNTMYEVRYTGPNNQQVTEITDGYNASLSFSEEPDLAAYVEEQNPATTTPQMEPFNDRDGMTYMTESQLSEQDTITHVVYRLFPESPWIVDIGYSVYGEQAAEYREEILGILDSLSFTESVGADQNETTLPIAMLDYDQVGEDSDGPTRGCDRLVFIEETIEATTTPLNAALRRLFEYEEAEVGGWQNFIAQTNNTLAFERASIDGGVASIYLTGELSGLAGACDNPRARTQIEETALQLDTVEEVVLYLNEEKTDLQPSEDGN